MLQIGGSADSSQASLYRRRLQFFRACRRVKTAIGFKMRIAEIFIIFDRG
jgi:hypothetical protein